MPLFRYNIHNIRESDNQFVIKLHILEVISVNLGNDKHPVKLILKLLSNYSQNLLKEYVLHDE